MLSFGVLQSRPIQSVVFGVRVELPLSENNYYFSYLSESTL